MVLSKKMNIDIKNIINDNINTTNDLLNEGHIISKYLEENLKL